jgi:branched-chain amino acid transport system ATP-binding protein
MLKVNGIRYAYSGMVAVRDVSMEVREREIVALIGSNGAGKTTSVKMIAGILHPSQGTIEFEEENISNLPSYKVVERGITLIPEGRLVFPQMTVLENLLLGAHSKRARPDLKSNLNRVFDIFSRLGERRLQLAGSLSGGEQQMLAVARGLMASPKMMVFDEPSLGLSPKLVVNLFELIRRLNNEGISILLVEQNANLSLQIANRAYVLEKGRVPLVGSGHELLNNSYIKKAFLGL